MRRNLALLALAQALLLATGVTIVAVSGLLGLQLAPDRRLATLPLTTYVGGAALAALFAARFMQRHGRRAGFMLGAGFALAAALVSALAIWAGSFTLLCLGTVLAGIYNAFGQQYRFAAADCADGPHKPQAISLTLGGGILGGVFGPEIAKFSRDLLAPTFLASHLALGLLALATMLVVSRLEVPRLTSPQATQPTRPWREIARDPAFVVALLAATCGFATMNLLMTATPLAMDFCGLPFSASAFVLQWHVIGMFAPSFFTGHLIQRFGVRRILLAGAVLMFACASVALAGVSLAHFWWSLLLLGAGWNFLFIGGTSLLVQTCRPEERGKVQGGNDFIVLATQALTSIASGLLIMSAGWHTLVWCALPLIAATTIASLRWKG